MSDTINRTLITEQKLTKPNIEDVAGDFLKGDMLKNALSFNAFLRENNMNPRWSSTNGWRVTGKKSKPICYIQFGGTNYAHMKYLSVGDWVIGELEGTQRKYLDEFQTCDEVNEFVWANIKPCNRCSSCGPRRYAYIGKIFDECCGLRIINPDEKGLELAKRLVLANRNCIYANT